ncbi:TPA: hypothetical protein ACHU7U_001675 [Streptococcus suis]
MFIVDIVITRCSCRGIVGKKSGKIIELTRVTGIEKRTVEQIVVKLRNKFKIPVYGLKRDNHFGYFIAQTEEERQAGIAAYRKQIDTSIKNLGVMVELDLEAYQLLVAS